MTDREAMSTPHAIAPELSRGAILPPEADPPVDARSVPLVAATYASPARTIVRLVAEPLLEAEDTALATQGFTRTRTTTAGRVRPTVIGFPAWPILVDPDNTRHALDLVGDVEWARRVAHSRPGDVKKRFEKLAAELTASAPTSSRRFSRRSRGSSTTSATTPRPCGSSVVPARSNARTTFPSIPTATAPYSPSSRPWASWGPAR
ncbi:hypothetical protein [Corynebacterium antarcticum]|uniref:hypothetical protein n=1 Tax=Corynebacterium antarcticum TaxID=2800405 RepID=UPI0020059D6A|nr:hypothetical protein [Corynebacterium antarcticum]MCK7661921.1 hypothetical protein [Corynebacterium antarcticum]MCX7492562.1 hypothetical protein [Corynebacterium antarcticum]